MYKSSTYVEENSSDDEFNTPMGAPATVEPTQEVDIDALNHLSSEQFSRVQKTILDIDFCGSPAEMAANKSLSQWSLLPHLSKEFKQNLAIKNRSVAGEDQLAGNLSRCIPLGFKVLQQKNSFPYPMEIKIAGMMDTTIHRHGKCLHRIPAETATMLVGLDVFQPENIVNQWAYKTWSTCSLEDLESDVNIVAKSSKKPAHANIAVGSLAYDTLVQNLNDRRMRKIWRDDIAQIDEDAIFTPGKAHTVQVTSRIGTDIIETLRPFIRQKIIL